MLCWLGVSCIVNEVFFSVLAARDFTQTRLCSVLLNSCLEHMPQGGKSRENILFLFILLRNAVNNDHMSSSGQPCRVDRITWEL